MIERLLRAGILVATVAVIVFGRPSSLHSQQPSPTEYVWLVAPNGVLSDMRIQDAIGQLVDPQAVLREAGISTTLRYGGGGINAPQAATKNDAIRLLMAAAGFNDPSSQLREVRRCRVWVVTPYVNAPEEQALMAALGQVIATSAASIGLTLQPCEQAASLDAADFVLWASTQQAPIPDNERGLPRSGESFLVATDRPAPFGTAPTPPRTGDGGLVGQ
jgi:hypothetical protein